MDGVGRRKRRRLDYCQLADVQVPRATKTRKKTAAPNQLYPVAVTEENELRVKVHYVGYSNSYDEWKDVSELETLGEAETESHNCLPTSHSLSTKIFV